MEMKPNKKEKNLKNLKHFPFRIFLRLEYENIYTI